jgi:hypothetical protein
MMQNEQLALHPSCTLTIARSAAAGSGVSAGLEFVFEKDIAAEDFGATS